MKSTVNTGTLFRMESGDLDSLDSASPGPAPDTGILGIPFDMGVHPTRIGGRGGPQHIRNHSYLVAEQASTLADSPLEQRYIVDFGDLAVTPGDTAQAYPIIENALTRMFEHGIVPVTLGGDGAVTLPILRAARAHFDDLCVLHFDSHTDAYLFEPQEVFTNANPFVHAVREELIDPATSFHIGVRSTGTVDRPGQVEDAQQFGYRLIPMERIETTPLSQISAEIVQTVGDRNVYVSWDMDVFDPSCAPGVVTPSWGGLTAREGLRLIRGLAGLNIVGCEVNTVSPTHDHAGLTGNLAAQVALDLLAVLSHRPQFERNDHDE